MILKPMNSDVALRKVEKAKYSGTGIFLGEDSEDDQQKFFEVVAVSPKVKSVRVGETVIVPWPRITDPVEVDIDGEPTMVGFTDEKEILAVIDGA